MVAPIFYLVGAIVFGVAGDTLFRKEPEEPTSDREPIDRDPISTDTSLTLSPIIPHDHPVRQWPTQDCYHLDNMGCLQLIRNPQGTVRLDKVRIFTSTPYDIIVTGPYQNFQPSLSYNDPFHDRHRSSPQSPIYKDTVLTTAFSQELIERSSPLYYSGFPIDSDLFNSGVFRRILRAEPIARLIPTDRISIPSDFVPLQESQTNARGDSFKPGDLVVIAMAGIPFGVSRTIQSLYRVPGHPTQTTGLYTTRACESRVVAFMELNNPFREEPVTDPSDFNSEIASMEIDNLLLLSRTPQNGSVNVQIGDQLETTSMGDRVLKVMGFRDNQTYVQTAYTDPYTHERRISYSWMD